MGVKRRRVKEKDIIEKNGKLYVKQKHQNHRVCECRIVYRNCVKCNKKLAKRHSDYIGLMVKHAKEYSLHRQKIRPNEDHSFFSKHYYQLIFSRINDSKMLCECELCISGDSRQHLSVRGPNKISMDRVHDHLGYTHTDQELRLVSKSHHSWQKRVSGPSLVLQKRKWIHAVKQGIVKRSKARYDRTLSEISEMEKAGMNTDDMKNWLTTHIIDHEKCISMLKEKMNSTPSCEKCGVELYYGNDCGFSETKHDTRKASPDRINNRIGYTSQNVRMVCHSCQTMESIDDPDDVFLNEVEMVELLEYIKSKM